MTNMLTTLKSYFHDLTRDEIIARYRERITADKRSKLGKSDLEQLILYLIDRLKTLDSQTEIKALCEAEIALLEEGYKTSTVAFDYLPKYRKAVEKVIELGLIPITANNSHRYIHSQRVTGIEEEQFEHYALTYLKYDADTYESLDTRSSETNRTKQLNLKGVNFNLYLNKLTKLLYSNDKFATRHQAIAIAGLTGRRLNEVLARGQFSLGEHPYLLRFEGHSKVEREADNIVTLVEAAQLLPIIEQFRESDEVQPLLTLTNDKLVAAINKFDVQVNRECNKYLADIVPPLEGREAVSIHNLRSLWGAIASYLFCPPTSHEYPFLQHYLGHAIDSAATGHYFRYRLIDGSGNYLEERGVKIAQFGELPLPHFQQAKAVRVEQTPSIPSADNTPETIEEASLVTEAVSEAVSGNETEITDEQLPWISPEQDIPSLSLLPSLADHPLAQSLPAPLTQLLNSDPAGISAFGGVRYTHRLTGVMAVTGLTAGELLKSKKFSPYLDDPFALLFSSTIATTKERLVTLVNAAAVLDAIARLKAHPDVQPLLYLSPNEIDSRCLSHVVRTLHSHLPFKNIEQMVAAYQSLVGTTEPPPETEKLKRPNTTIYNIYTDDRHRLEAIANEKGFSGSQAAIFHSLIDWVEKQLEREATPVEAQPNQSLQALTEQAKTLTWLTNEITSLRERVATLELERDQLKSQLEQNSTPDPQLEALHLENERLSTGLDKANSTMAMFRQLLNGDADAIDQPPTAPSKTQQKTPVEAPPSAIVSQSSPPSETPLVKPPQNQAQNRRRPRSDGGAKARAIAIWEALQQWNTNHPDNTFALTPALLEVTFHIHRAAAHEFIHEYRTQIDDHHRAIGVGTLRTHNRGKDIQPLKAFVDASG